MFASDEFSDSPPGDHKEKYLDDEPLNDHLKKPHTSYTDSDVSWTDKLEGKTQPVVEDGIGNLDYLWILISCGYMVSWTSIGSLIAFFKARQGADFYVKIYCAFYLPGLPISLLQQRYDEQIEQKFGSARAYMYRVCTAQGLKIVTLFIMPFVPRLVSDEDAIPNIMLGFMVVIGIFSWTCHGTACQLCSMFPPSSTAYLQTGFRTPEIYTVLMVWGLHLGANASEFNVVAFYYATSLIVVIGTFCWIIICRTKHAKKCFALKDETYASRVHADATGEKTSLLAGEGGAADESREEVAAAVLPCRIAIFLNIWSSIFSAAFFAYVQPAGNIDTEMVLYFVRLFSDLVGRPLARLPRPSWISNKDQLVRIAAIRLLLLVVFFCYIGFDWMPKSDAFIIGVVAIFSILSGYLAVLSYEYAAASLQTKAGQSMAGTLMNSTFQTAAFTAVIMGVVVSQSGLFKDPSSADESWTDDFFASRGNLHPDVNYEDDDATADALS